MVGIFPICPDLPSDPPRLLYNWYRVFTGVKAARAWRWPSTSSCVQVKETVQLHLYSPCGPSRQVTGWTLPFVVRRWNYVPNKEWEVYWLMTNGKDIEGSHGLCVASPGFPLVTGWKGDPQAMMVHLRVSIAGSVTNLAAMFRELEEMEDVQERKWNEAKESNEIETDGIWPAFLNGPWW